MTANKKQLRIVLGTFLAVALCLYILSLLNTLVIKNVNFGGQTLSAGSLLLGVAHADDGWRMTGVSVDGDGTVWVHETNIFTGATRKIAAN